MIKAHFPGRMVSSGISDISFSSVHFEKNLLLPARASEQGNWRASEASESLFRHVYGNSRYVYIFNKGALALQRKPLFTETIITFD